MGYTIGGGSKGRAGCGQFAGETWWGPLEVRELGWPGHYLTSSFHKAEAEGGLDGE